MSQEESALEQLRKEIELFRDNPIQFFSEEPEKFIRHVLLKIRNQENRLDTIEQFLQARFPAFVPYVAGIK